MGKLVPEKLDVLLHRLVEAGTVKDVGDVLAKITLEIFDWDAFIFSKRIEGTDEFYRVVAWDILDGRVQELDPDLHPVKPYRSREELHRGESLLIENRMAEEEILRRFGNTSRPSACLLFVPIHYMDTLHGIISIQSYTPAKFDEEDQRQLELIARMAAPAMRRALAEMELEERLAELQRAYGSIKRQTAIQETIYKIAKAGRQPGKPEDLFPEIHAAIRQVIDAENFYIAISLPARKLLRFTYAVDKNCTLQGVEEPAEKTLASQVLKSRQSMLVGIDEYNRKVASGELPASRFPAKSWLGVPLIHGDEAIGVMVVLSYDQEDAYDETDKEMMEIVSTEIASIIEYTRILEEIRTNEERYRMAITQTGAVPYQRSFDREGWVYLGDGIEKLVGYPVWEFNPRILRSMILRTVLHGEAKGKALEEAIRLSRDGEIDNWYSEYLIRLRDGGERWLSDSSVLMKDDAGKAIGTVGILQDITRNVEARRLNEGSGILNRKLAGAGTIEQVGRSIAMALDEVFGWDALFLYLYDVKTGLCKPLLEYDLINNMRRETQPENPSFASPSDTFKKVLRDGAFVLSDTREDTAHKRRSSFGNPQLKSASVLYAPVLHVDGTPLAMISIQSYTPGHYTGLDLELFKELCSRSGGVIYRILTEAKIREAQTQASILASVGRDLSHASTVEDAARIIMRAADFLNLGWDACFLDLYDQENNLIREVIALDTVDGERVRVDKMRASSALTSTEKRVLSEGAFLLNRDPGDTVDTGLMAFGESRRSASLMFAPARHAGRVVAFLSLQSYTRHAYTKDSLNTLQILADHCGGALERIHLIQVIKLSEERFALAARGSNDGLWDLDLVKNRIHLSERWKEMLGYKGSDIGSDPNEWFDRVHKEDLPALKEALRAHYDGETDHFEAEFRMVGKSNQSIWVLCRGMCVHDEEGRAIRIAGSLTDISLRKLQEAQLVRSAFYDPLTGLANRALFMDRLGQCIERSKRNRRYRFGVMFMDLDHFKAVNDTHGHPVGDKLLHAVGERLQRHFRSGDTIARLGGDEFTVVLDDMKNKRNIVTIAERLLLDLNKPFEIGGKSIQVGVSIGIATSETRYTKVEDIIRDADMALYRAKEQGKGRYEIFDLQMRKEIQETRNMEQAILEALDRKEFILHYQPVFNLETGELRGLEALLRWRQPDGELMTPLDFLPVAEESGLILPIGEWVLGMSIAQLAAWRKHFGKRFARIHTSINLSPRQFADRSLPKLIGNLLAKHKVPGDVVHVELTDSALQEKSRTALETMKALKELGIHVMLDDFGAGFTSLELLQGYPIDTLKIDRTFVDRLAASPASQYVIRAVIGVAGILNMRVVAKGAETSEQLEQLKEMKCGYAQGFLLAAALDADAMTVYLEEKLKPTA